MRPCATGATCSAHLTSPFFHFLYQGPLYLCHWPHVKVLVLFRLLHNFNPSYMRPWILPWLLSRFLMLRFCFWEHKRLKSQDNHFLQEGLFLHSSRLLLLVHPLVQARSSSSRSIFPVEEVERCTCYSGTEAFPHCFAMTAGFQRQLSYTAPQCSIIVLSGTTISNSK